jgi:hypothetical protein
VARLVTADISSLTCPAQLRSTALHIQPRTTAQHLAAVDCVNEPAMTKRYDPGQVTHPLGVAQSAAWIGGATGMYATVTGFPFPHVVFLSCHSTLYAPTPNFLMRRSVFAPAAQFSIASRQAMSRALIKRTCARPKLDMEHGTSIHMSSG